MHEENLDRLAGPARREPTATPGRGAFHQIGLQFVQRGPYRPRVPEHAIVAVEGQVRAFDPDDVAAMRLFHAGFSARRDDGELMTEACRQLQLLVDIAAYAPAGRRIELANIDNLHGDAPRSAR